MIKWNRTNSAVKEMRRVMRFFFGSLAGVSVDLVVFQSAILLGLSAFISNFLSSTLAIIITYLLVTRYTFGVKASSVGFVLFAGWYVCSIYLFSILISYLVDYSDWPAIVCKLLSLPFSFAVNFLFSRIFFVRSRVHG
jgi:putative flippase GtrA